jgi:hypothetical protein
MDTQLVRLDAPYNIICGTDGSFALHIATLIVTKERIEGMPDGVPMRDTVSVATYPVVSKKYGAGGQVWMNSELKDCYVICDQGSQTVQLKELKKLMEYCAKNNFSDVNGYIPMAFNIAMIMYDCHIVLPLDGNNNRITDYEVCLEFEEGNNGKTCMAYADEASQFYFYEYFENEPPFSPFVPTNSEAIGYMAKLRDDYLRIFRHEGVRSITFTTKSEKYQWFVDKLNGSKANGEQV